MEDSPLDTQLPESHGDDWHNVTDARKRKQIQDRLAQRARRRRLREGKKLTQHFDTYGYSDVQADQTSLASSTGQSLVLPPDVFSLMPCPRDDTLPISLSYSSFSGISRVTQASPLSFERPIPLTVFGALYINGQILGLTCSSNAAGKSLPASPDVPAPLQPTPTQLNTVHFTGVDRFPFPRMRDNIILMSTVIDEEDFSYDLFTIPSFSLAPGTAPWDPRGWKIEKAFADKWGFLFC